MRSRVPVAAAVAVALMALLVVLWSFQGDDSETPRSAPPGAIARPDGALLRNRTLPTLRPGSAPEAGQVGVAEPTPGPGSDETRAEEAARVGRRQNPGYDAWVASQRARAQTPVAAAATERDVAVANEDLDGGHGGALPPDPVPTFAADSIYDGLSQDDLLELMVAMRRLRDAGVFVKLTPDQYAEVAKLLPDAQGVQDAERITQQILGMGVGEWLEHERGPKGRFVLH